LRPVLLLACALAAPACAQDDDAAALRLADTTEVRVETVRNWQVFSELAWSRATLARGGASLPGARLSLGARYENAFAPHWRFVFDDRYDATWQDNPAQHDQVNTLQEAYLSWQPQPDRIGDLGRINTRYGVAFGYNPTDYFKTGAVRLLVSSDPSSARENRLGSVMARAQTIWTGGSLTAIYAPKLADDRNTGTFDPDFGATNGSSRWLLAASEQFSDRFNPQWLLSGTAGHAPQFGVNATTLLNDATVGHLEWSGGRAPSLLAQALSLDDDTAARSRMAAGITYTTPAKLSLTLEYEYNGAGLDRAAWEGLATRSPAAYRQYRAFVGISCASPTRRRVFLRTFWQDAGINHLDLTVNIFVDVVDSSRQCWTEARYHWSRLDIALQWQLNSGGPLSEYGALAQHRTWLALARYYF
jgi:hypothetical protein